MVQNSKIHQPLLAHHLIAIIRGKTTNEEIRKELPSSKGSALLEDRNIIQSRRNATANQLTTLNHVYNFIRVQKVKRGRGLGSKVSYEVNYSAIIKYIMAKIIKPQIDEDDEFISFLNTLQTIKSPKKTDTKNYLKETKKWQKKIPKETELHNHFRYYVIQVHKEGLITDQGLWEIFEAWVKGIGAARNYINSNLDKLRFFRKNRPSTILFYELCTLYYHSITLNEMAWTELEIMDNLKHYNEEGRKKYKEARK